MLILFPKRFIPLLVSQIWLLFGGSSLEELQYALRGLARDLEREDRWWT